MSIVLLWARTLRSAGTFLGLLSGGLAIALKEPLPAIAGRIAILAGHIYTVGNRIQVEQIRGDVTAAAEQTEAGQRRKAA